MYTVKKKILLVEDDAITAMLEKQQLEKKGYSVHHVTTGEDAVKVILGNTLPVDLVLMDIDLGPGIDGTQAAEQILNHKDIPVVFLSSHTEQVVVEKTEKITSYGYVVKSSSIVVLDASIKMALKLFKARRLVNDTFTHSINGFCVHRIIRDESGHLHDCEYLQVNGAFERHTGLFAHDIIGRTIRDLYPGSVADNVTQLYDEVLSGRADARQEVYFKPTQTWYDISIFRTQEDEFTVVVHNITDRKRAEEALKKSEFSLEKRNSFINTILENLTFGIAVTTIDSGVTKYINPAYSRVYGWPAEDMKDVDIFFKLIYPDPVYSAQQKKMVMEDIGSGDPQRMHWVDFMITTKTGEERYIEARNIPLPDQNLMISTAWDVTERKRAEEALRDSNTLIRAALNLGQLGTWEFDIAGNTFKATDEFWTILGTSAEEMGGYTLSAESLTERLMHPEDKWMIAEELRKAIETTDAVYRRRFESRLIHADGHTIYVDTSFCVLKDAQNKAIKAVGMDQDITERKRAEEEIIKQLAEKEMLLQEVHHRVKNNIANIEGLLSLQADSSANPEVKTALQVAISRVQSIRILYDKLLITNDYQNISIQSYAENIIDSLLAVFDLKNNIIIEKHISDFSILSKQAITIGIIINELLTNVFKYAFKDHDGGTVSVSLEKKEKMVTIIIQDDGIGIDERIMENKSAGFGLTIVKMLVEQLKGTYSIVNGNGTRSVIEFEI